MEARRLITRASAAMSRLELSIPLEWAGAAAAILLARNEN
jgi:hypothetical protein